jgi:ribosomal protein S2
MITVTETQEEFSIKAEFTTLENSYEGVQSLEETPHTIVVKAKTELDAYRKLTKALMSFLREPRF